jgi:hypothetical protein
MIYLLYALIYNCLVFIDYTNLDNIQNLMYIAE